MGTGHWLGGIAVGLALAGLACGDEFETAETAPPVPCNEDPWTCEPPQTCWIFTDYTFQCINANTGTIGQSCTALLGSTQCAAGLACFTSGSTQGICRPFCDPRDATRACPDGTCVSATYQTPGGDALPPIWICAP